MKIIFSYCISFLIFSTSAFTQAILSGNATARIDSFINSMPATSYTNEYQPLNPSQEIAWAEMVDNLIDGNLSAANIIASGIGYRVIVFIDTVQVEPITYYFVEKHPDSLNFWGTLVFNPNPVRSKLTFQVAHPLGDLYTGAQGFYMFKKTGAYLYCITGAHRCNNSDSTNCSGRTDVCSGLIDARYRKSEQAHSLETVFQVTTEVLLNHFNDMIFIQPHGFLKLSGDPDLILSNGTRYTPSTDYLCALRDSIGSLNPFLKIKIAHVDTNWSKLIALTNTQGRLINGSPNPCYINSVSSTGRFIHIEQAPYLRYPKMWFHLNDALLKVIPMDPFSSRLIAMTAKQENNNILIQWETNEEKGNYGFELQKYNRSENGWIYLSFISSYGAPNLYKYYDEFTQEDTILYRLKQINIDGTYKILSPVVVNLTPPAAIVLYDNYPNPFNSSTIISFVLPEAGKADLSVYNMLGEKITTLASGELTGGNHKITFNADMIAAGVYFYKLTTPAFTQTKKLLLLK